MHGKCGSLDDAASTFNTIRNLKKVNVAMYTAMINVYGLNGMGKEALQLFKEMQKDQIQPNSVTIISILNACSHCGMVEETEEILYSLNLFNIPPNISHYNCLIKCLIQAERLNEAICILDELQYLEIVPDEITYVLLCTAVADAAAVSISKVLHNTIAAEISLLENVELLNALINMHGKCGSIVDAVSTFNTSYNLKKANVITYTTMINVYGLNGMGKEALQLFNQMQKDQIQPNSFTITSVFNSCSHCGMVDEALEIFNNINTYNIPIESNHIVCIVDTLSRKGLLEQAEDFMKKHSISLISLVSLLAGCRKYNDLERAERIFTKILEINPKHEGSFVLMANLYASNGLHEKSKQIREKMTQEKVFKIPGKTTLDINGEVHIFHVDDFEHSEIDEIYKELKVLNHEIVEAGYVPDTSVVIRDLESEEEKRDALSKHSEKIAIAYALISTPPYSPITLTNNLRICGDCHSASKFISKIRNREIHIRDANRFHHFKDGKCSCDDYW